MAPESPFLEQMERLKRQGEQRWRRPDGSLLYTWDRLHEHVEVWDKRGHHRGAVDPVSGVFVKDPEKGRRIDV